MAEPMWQRWRASSGREPTWLALDEVIIVKANAKEV